MNRSRLARIVIATVALGGCGASLARVSTGHVGCAERDITITNDRGGWGTRTWMAHCQGRSYFCSATAGGNSTQIACRPALDSPPAWPAPTGTGPPPAYAPPPAYPPPPGHASPPVTGHPPANAPPAAGEGCRYDTQCKGDRICRDGSCVDP